MKSCIINENRSDVICILADWENVAEGIFFTDKAIYVNSPKNENKKFSIRYYDIIELKYYSSTVELKIITKSGDTYYITTPMWSKRNIKVFLEIASGIMNLDDEDMKRVEHIELLEINNENIGSLASGVIYGNVSNASTVYGMDKFNTPRGHGFAAERANHIYDKISGKDAKIVGDDNVKFGADRIVEVLIFSRNIVVLGLNVFKNAFMRENSNILIQMVRQ